jgi:hypothetical protein
VIDPSALLTVPARPHAIDERVDARVPARHDREQINSALGKERAVDGSRWKASR